MNCCVECFQDIEIRKIIVSNNKLGYCDFCEKSERAIYDISLPSDLSELIYGIISVYKEVEKGEPLFEILIEDWNIFNKQLPKIRNLVEKFCDLTMGNLKNSNNINVEIPKADMENYGVFSGHTWVEFSNAIKTTNRFHSGFFKADQLASFLSYSTTKYSKGTILFRARVCSDRNGYKTGEMGPPEDIEKRKSGRVNPEGIGVLYLTSDEKTALSEVRASAFDFVSLGEFRLKKDIKVVNISGLQNISPAVYDRALESLAANIKVFSDIAKEIAKPLRRNDSTLEYLPTQYITEFIKSKGYSGVEFSSTMSTGGINIAAFDKELFECVAVHNVEIKKIEYLYENIL